MQVLSLRGEPGADIYVSLGGYPATIPVPVQWNFVQLLKSVLTAKQPLAIKEMRKPRVVQCLNFHAPWIQMPDAIFADTV